MKKIIIFGCQEITVDIINYLSKRRDVGISLVVTYELPLDKTYNYKIVSEFCKKNSIKFINYHNFDNNLYSIIKTINPDLIITSYFRKIIPTQILKEFKNIINLHPSYLPFYRGPVPTAWAILNNEEYIGFTIHKVDSGIDTGNILVRKKIKILKDETGYQLYRRVMKLGFKIFRDNFENILKKKIKAIKQMGYGSYFGKINVEHFIDWRNKKSQILNFIRVYSYPYSSAKTKLFNKIIFIDKASEYKPKKNIKAQKPGKIIKFLNKKYLVINCADGLIKLEKYYFSKKLTKVESDIYLKVGNQFE